MWVMKILGQLPQSSWVDGRLMYEQPCRPVCLATCRLLRYFPPRYLRLFSQMSARTGVIGRGVSLIESVCAKLFLSSRCLKVSWLTFVSLDADG